MLMAHVLVQPSIPSKAPLAQRRPFLQARCACQEHKPRLPTAGDHNAPAAVSPGARGAWVGHRSPDAARHYAQITLNTLARAYADAGYFARNVRAVEVLIDRDAATSGAAAAGEPWQYYDLGPRILHLHVLRAVPPPDGPCAKCDFYTPKQSSRALLLEAKDNLQRMLAAVPLTDGERAAVDDG